MSINLNYSAGNIAKAWAQIYSAASSKPLPTSILHAPAGSEPYVELLYRGAPFKLVETVDCRGEVKPEKNAIIVFSGGKDSTATALRMRKQGYAPILLFTQGINPKYPLEIEAAKKVSTFLQMPLRIVSVSKAHGDYVENPTKNQMLLAIAADLAPKWSASKIAMGMIANRNLTNVDFEAGYSDAVEMHALAGKWIESNLQGVQVEPPLVKNDTDSFLEVVDTGVLPLLQSCMATPRFRNSLHKSNQAKFKLELMPERCGSCFKCALEYLHLALTHRVTWNQGFVHHCVDVLKKRVTQNTGKRVTKLEAVKAYLDEQQINLDLLKDSLKLN